MNSSPVLLLLSSDAQIGKRLYKYMDRLCIQQTSWRREREYHHGEIKLIPYTMIHVGHLVSLSTHIFEHIFVIVDAFTKFILVRTVKSTATRDIIDTLLELARYVGMPSRIVSDQRTAFTSMTSANSLRLHFSRRRR